VLGSYFEDASTEGAIHVMLLFDDRLNSLDFGKNGGDQKLYLLV
jgi:hypothetical protein